MRAFCFAVLSLALLAGQRAQAQQGTVSGAEMLWYGIYTVRQAREIKDPNAAGGVRFISSGIVGPDNNSDRIALRDGIRVGFGYNLLGRPRSTVVPIVHVTQFTVAEGEDVSKNIKSEKVNYNLAIGQDGLFIGRVIDNAETSAAGVYIFQVWHRDRLLLEKQITLYKR